MSDERLRALERRWKESGAAEDELAWLNERVRQGESLEWVSYSRLAELSVEGAAAYLKATLERGDVTAEAVNLAAHCAHAPAMRASARSSPIPTENFRTWCAQLPATRQSALRVLLALTRTLVPGWRAPPNVRAGGTEAVLGALAQFEARPGPETQARVREVLDRYYIRREEVDDQVAEAPHEAACAAAEVTFLPDEEIPGTLLYAVDLALFRRVSVPGVEYDPRAVAAAKHAGVNALCRDLVKELLYPSADAGAPQPHGGRPAFSAWLDARGSTPDTLRRAAPESSRQEEP